MFEPPSSNPPSKAKTKLVVSLDIKLGDLQMGGSGIVAVLGAIALILK